MTRSHDTILLTFSPSLSLLLLPQSAWFVLATSARHCLCAGGWARVWLPWLQLHHFLFCQNAGATVTPWCSAVIFTSCGADSLF